MTLADVLGYFFVATCLASTVYAAMSRDLFRVSIAFFLELASVGGVLLTLNADYLALIVLVVGIMGTILVISFSTIIMGSLKESFQAENDPSRGNQITKALGMALGLALGGVIGWAFLTAPFLDASALAEPASQPADVQLLGRMMLGEQIAVFELLGVLVLAVVVGAGLLLRKPDNAD